MPRPTKHVSFLIRPLCWVVVPYFFSDIPLESCKRSDDSYCLHPVLHSNGSYPVGVTARTTTMKKKPILTLLVFLSILTYMVMLVPMTLSSPPIVPLSPACLSVNGVRGPDRAHYSYNL